MKNEEVSVKNRSWKETRVWRNIVKTDPLAKTGWKIWNLYTFTEKS